LELEKRAATGRSAIPKAQMNIIKQMADDNPFVKAPRIPAGMLQLGFDITPPEYMPSRADAFRCHFLRLYSQLTTFIAFLRCNS